MKFVMTILTFIILLLEGYVISGGTSWGGCDIFPPDNVWNTPIDHLPVHSRSSQYIQSIGASTTIHPDFGAAMWNGGPIGIPITVVTNPNQALVDIQYTLYKDESDLGKVPIPTDAKVEGGRQSNGDRHVLVFDQTKCMLYELYKAYPTSNPLLWKAGNTAYYDLNSHALRPAGWTSADAAGLPIMPGLVRAEEVQAGEVTHAIRFTAEVTRREYIWPARHYASSETSLNVPPMGARFRLKSSYNIDNKGFSEQTKVILRALKKYGLILADNGSNWYLNGVPSPLWDDDSLVGDMQNSGLLKGSDFEAVDASSLMINVNSGKANQPGPITPTTNKPTSPPTTAKPTTTLKPTTPKPTTTKSPTTLGLTFPEITSQTILHPNRKGRKTTIRFSATGLTSDDMITFQYSKDAGENWNVLTYMNAGATNFKVRITKEMISENFKIRGVHWNSETESDDVLGTTPMIKVQMK